MIRRYGRRGDRDGRVREGEGGANGVRGGTRRKMSMERNMAIASASESENTSATEPTKL